MNILNIPLDEHLINVLYKGKEKNEFIISIDKKNKPLEIMTHSHHITINSFWDLYFKDLKSEELFIEQLMFILEEILNIPLKNRVTRTLKIVKEDELRIENSQ